MPEPFSPLRYPGGKAGLAPFIARVLRENRLLGGIYAEPYAGGAGAALELLIGEDVDQIIINDFDRRIFAFWWAVLNRTEEFVNRIETVPLNVAEWRRQRATYLSPGRIDRVTLGFATFFLNRCNRSGILRTGGPIGGHDQAGKWKIDARFNRPKLAARVRRVARFAERIELRNLDALDILRDISKRVSVAKKAFVYLDPPYYVKGRQLYFNNYQDADHRRLARFFSGRKPYKWLISYDNSPEIKALYKKRKQRVFDLPYTAHRRRIGQELLIYDDSLAIPESAWAGLEPALAGWTSHNATATQ